MKEEHNQNRRKEKGLGAEQNLLVNKREKRIQNRLEGREAMRGEAYSKSWR